MLIEYDTYTIAEHWITAIEYGDYSGLEDGEEAELEAFLSTLPCGPLCWSWSDDREFSRDAVSGLMADCVEARLWVSSSNI